MKRISEKVIFHTRLFEIKDIRVETPKGIFTYQIISKGQTVLIVPVTRDNKLILVREYFVAINQYGLTFPKGRIDKGHDALETANKELQEEIGFKANKLEKIAILTMSPGYSTHKTHIFLASNLEPSKLTGDETEELEVKIYTVSQIEELIEKGEINEARTISAFYLAKNKLAPR